MRGLWIRFRVLGFRGAGFKVYGSLGHFSGLLELELAVLMSPSFRAVWGLFPGSKGVSCRVSGV